MDAFISSSGPSKRYSDATVRPPIIYQGTPSLVGRMLTATLAHASLTDCGMAICRFPTTVEATQEQKATKHTATTRLARWYAAWSAADFPPRDSVAAAQPGGNQAGMVLSANYYQPTLHAALRLAGEHSSSL